MKVAAGAGATLGPDAGFAHLCQGAFEGGPQGNDFACEGFLGRTRNFGFHIGMYILLDTYNAKSKKTPWLPKRTPRSGSLHRFLHRRAGRFSLPANCWASSWACCRAANFGSCLASKIRDFMNG